MNNNYFVYVGIALGILVVAGAAWFLFSRSPGSAPAESAPINFGIGDNRTVVVNTASSTGNQAVGTTQNTQKIFKVADGPITGATLVQTTLPTTTIARYVLAENGHVQDLVLDTPGAVARPVSNTTIPGTVRATWAKQGGAVLLQYLDAGIIKTLYLGFPVASSIASSTQSVAVIHFLPDNISDFAVSPDGTQIVYLLTNASGSVGYRAAIDGSGSIKLFTLPLRDILLSWPASGTLLAAMKSAAGIPGVVFSVDAKNGSVVPLLYAPGVTATADTSFAHVLYQTISGGNAPSTYIRDVKNGTEAGLSFDPIPEKCIWGGAIATSTLYCATPVQYVPPEYLDLWHQGAASLADAIISYDITTRSSTILAIPGSDDGGVQTDAAEMSVSPDGKYILFIKKGDRSLWAVRLGTSQ